MKKLFIILFPALININVFSQAPQKMSYQAVIRNSSNVLITNTSIGMRVNILQGSTSGSVVFQEIFNPNPQTNSNGLVTVEIGTGTPIIGTFGSINWATGPYFVMTETDPLGGTAYSIMGVQQLLSVPYALYSATSGNVYTPLPPTVSSQMATNVSANSATLNGVINANGYSTSISFQYGLTTSYGSTSNGTPSIISGNASTPASVNITGLSANSVYHYRVKATNAVDVSYSSDLTFTTTGAPTVITQMATNILENSAKLNGYINANGNSTSVNFEYGLTTSYGNTVTGTPSIITGNTATTSSVTITGLLGNSLYHFRVNGTNTVSASYGADLTFTTTGLPTICCLRVDTVNASTIQFEGAVNPNSITSTTITFEYGTGGSYGTSVSATPSPITGNTYTTVLSNNISTLVPGTTYGYRIKAINANGTTYSNGYIYIR